jgi:ABC transport system ATP-binding/permease protein
MNLIALEDITKSYGVKPLLDGVSLGVQDDEKIGVIGTNGSGKTTLLRIMAGEELPDRGRVVTTKEKRITYLSQNPQFEETQIVLDAVIEANSETLQLLHEYENTCATLAAQAST